MYVCPSIFFESVRKIGKAHHNLSLKCAAVSKTRLCSHFWRNFVSQSQIHTGLSDNVLVCIKLEKFFYVVRLYIFLFTVCWFIWCWQWYNCRPPPPPLSATVDYRPYFEAVLKNQEQMRGAFAQQEAELQGLRSQVQRLEAAVAAGVEAS